MKKILFLFLFLFILNGCGIKEHNCKPTIGIHSTKNNKVDFFNRIDKLHIGVKCKF
ncbi:MAG: hypothetical protein BWY04_01366 [candidate division CPR1 bacterium ADurb.Bin160]|uniref:Lipoprotein n=1 Tax=candidate division CPR1 bacterium ADurb.Bin160 TaxID=1852826 RepID=A0A1V5ZJL9_9BACT|nr:MAG: hypothetical protein BWY04_01366 [candidate division CPR1 bacterium ADurb.Bin160]